VNLNEQVADILISVNANPGHGNFNPLFDKNC